MASRAKQQCRVCGGESFTTAHGLKVCDQCGRQEEHYIELLSQETIGEVDRSRLIKTHLQDPENEDGPPPPQEKEPNNWTSYEAYNYILCEWTKAMVKLGASPKFEDVIFKLWVAYLQRKGIAFVQTKRKHYRSSLQNTRDKKIIHEKAESVCSRSLHSYRHQRKKKKAKPTKLDKIKDKIEWKKLRNEMKKKKDTSFLNSTLASELSKSLNEFEASMLSDSYSSSTPSHGGRSRKNISIKSEPSSFMEGSSLVGSLNSSSETEREAPPCLRKEQMHSDNVVRNWIKRTRHIYRSDSEEDLQQEDETKVEEELSHGNSTRETDNEEEEDQDQDLVVQGERFSSSEQGRVSSKRRRKTHKIQKPGYRTHLKKAVKEAGRVTPYRSARLPFILSFSKLLSLLYLAVLLAEEDFLLSDIIRWCREGHIPYFSAPYLLRPNMEVGYYDLFMMRNCKNLPNAEKVQAIAGRLAVFLSIQCVPLPTMESIVKKFVKELNLPEEVTTVAEGLVKLVDDMQVDLSVPPVESMAMASIIMALKMFCGLDSHTEVMLSRGADVVKTELPSYTSLTPFSWQDWQRHISRLVWVCCQVNPPTAFHWQPLHEVRHFSPEVFSKYFWSEGMWRIPRTSLKKKADMQVLTEELLEQQGLTLEKVIMEPPLFEPSCQPLRSTIEQLLQSDPAAASKEIQRHIKVAEELKKESFTNHSLYWMDDMDCLASELRKSGSKTKLYLIRRKDNVSPTKAEDLNLIQPKGRKLRNENLPNTPHELLIPHPLTHYWKIMKKKDVSWEKLSPSLPFSFKWLLGVGSNVCETSRMQILTLLCLLQRKIKPKKCS